MTAQQFCGECGKPNREQARFCGYCGRPLETTVPQKEGFSHESLQQKTGPLQNVEHGFRQSDQQDNNRETRKSLSRVIIMVALFGLLVFTNPTLDEYALFVRQKMVEQAKTDEQRAAVLLFGGLGIGLVLNQTVRKNYILFSIYESKDMKDRDLIALGVLNNFIILSRS